ncbi:MAG: 50S ribosomal protein L25/general stress protein Ctc [candidate division Zixibacteria bacterium]|nr:50S ribosomal protein L25/general stress protein Ctc [candidate division Zixibacteria bacterium]
MKEIVIKAKARDKRGKKHAKKLRREGTIPAVVYGAETAPLPLEVEAKSFHTLLRSGLGENVVITLNIDEKKNGDKKVLIREVQRDPVWENILHIDFQQISLTKKLTINVPIQLVGTPIGVQQDGGILQHVLRELEVECLPTDIPEKIEVDVAHLKIGDSIHVGDIKLEKAEILSDPQGSLVSVVPPTVFKEPEVAPAATAEEPEVITEKKEEEEEKEAKAEKKEEPEKGAKEEKPADTKTAGKEGKKKEGK